MNNLLISVNAVIPFFIYLLFGFVVRVLKIVDETFLNKLNQIIFAAFFPFKMFYNIYNIDFDFHSCIRLMIITVITLFILILLCLLIVPKLVKENPKRGVIIQSLYRSNVVLYALPLAESLYGSAGAGIASIVIVVCASIYNVTSIIILEYFRGNAASLKMLFIKVFKNPMLQGAIVGIIFALLSIHLPSSIDSCVKTIANVTTPLALMTLGGTTHFSSIKKNFKYIVPTLSVKLVLFPMLVVFIGHMLGLVNLDLFIYFIVFATPVAVASYSMAANMGGDGQLSGELVSISTVVSIFTLFLWLLFMTNFGLIWV